MPEAVTTVVNVRDHAYDVYIGRPSKWGNKFVLGTHGSRETVIAKYRDWFHSDAPEVVNLRKATLQELKGKRLGCFCAPLQCHGDVLAAFVNRGVVKEGSENDLIERVARLRADLLGEPQEVVENAAEDPFSWRLVNSPEDVAELLLALAWFNGSIGIDCETDLVGDKPNETGDKLVGVGIEVDGKCFYGPFDYEPWVALLRTALADRSFVAHNSKYDMVVLERYGISVGPVAGDGMLAAYLLGYPEIGLKALVKGRYGHTMMTYEEVAGDRPISEVAPELTARYCAADAYWGRRLAEDLDVELLNKNAQTYNLYRECDLPLVKTLADMEREGIGFDLQEASKRRTQAIGDLYRLSETINQMAKADGFQLPLKRRVCKACRNGKKKKLTCGACDRAGEFFDLVPLNPGSSVQVAAWLHEYMGLPIQDITAKTNRPAITALALLRLQKHHPAAALLLAYKRLEKFRGYLESWIELAQPRTGCGERPCVNPEHLNWRIHTTFTNSFVRSGRLSSREPNLQQVKLGWRDLFVASEGKLLVAGDYAQLEIRVAAYISRDPALLAIVRADPNTPIGDFHGLNVLKLFGIPFEKQREHPDLRVRAKNYGFGALYGSKGPEVQAVIEQVMLDDPTLGEPPSLKEIAGGIKGIHDIYPHYFREWVPFMLDRIRWEQDCTSYTMVGRPRRLPELRSLDKAVREAAERAAINHQIQGTASDLARYACNRVARLQHGRLLLQVHDELLCEVDEDREEWYSGGMRLMMELGQPLEGVPLVVDIVSGRTWKDTHR